MKKILVTLATLVMSATIALAGAPSGPGQRRRPLLERLDLERLRVRPGLG